MNVHQFTATCIPFYYILLIEVINLVDLYFLWKTSSTLAARCRSSTSFITVYTYIDYYILLFYEFYINSYNAHAQIISLINIYILVQLSIFKMDGINWKVITSFLDFLIGRFDMHCSSFLFPLQKSYYCHPKPLRSTHISTLDSRPLSLKRLRAH